MTRLALLYSWTLRGALILCALAWVIDRMEKRRTNQ